MAAWSGGSNQCCLLLLLLLPTLLLAQDDCSHNCNNEANRYYYVRPEGSAETLCPAQPCLTPSQLREHFSECERNSSCQTANIPLVLLPGTYTSASNHGSFIPPLKFLSLIGYNDDCHTFFFFLQIYLHSTCKKVTQIAEANTSVKPELQVIMNTVI